MTPESLIRQFDLRPHPEGGYYRETFRSSHQHAPEQAESTLIYYLLEGGDFSAFHRIRSDEFWFLHAGEGLYIHEITTEGVHHRHELSPNHDMQTVIPRGSWFAAEPITTQGWALVSCVCVPGFLFSQFEMADRNTLIESFPAYRPLIERLCR